MKIIIVFTVVMILAFAVGCSKIDYEYDVGLTIMTKTDTGKTYISAFNNRTGKMYRFSVVQVEGNTRFLGTKEIDVEFPKAKTIGG